MLRVLCVVLVGMALLFPHAPGADSPPSRWTDQRLEGDWRGFHETFPLDHVALVVLDGPRTTLRLEDGRALPLPPGPVVVVAVPAGAHTMYVWGPAVEVRVYDAPRDHPSVAPGAPRVTADAPPPTKDAIAWKAIAAFTVGAVGLVVSGWRPGPLVALPTPALLPRSAEAGPAAQVPPAGATKRST